MLMRPLEHFFFCLPPTSVKTVKAALSLTDGGESRRVIGSSVTQACVSDSDTSNNEGNAWSASHSTISQKGPISAIQWSVTHWCGTHLALGRFHNSNGTL